MLYRKRPVLLFILLSALCIVKVWVIGVSDDRERSPLRHCAGGRRQAASIFLSRAVVSSIAAIPMNITHRQTPLSGAVSLPLNTLLKIGL